MENIYRKSFIFCFALLISFPAWSGVRQVNPLQQTHNHHYDWREWHYHDFIDTASGVTFHTATKISNSPVDAASGTLLGQLYLTQAKKLLLHFAIRQKPGYAYLDCPAPCNVTMQFDDADPITVTAKVLSSGRHLDLKPAADLIARIKDSSQVKITIPVKSEGQVNFEFSVSDLEWPRDDK